MHWILQNNMYNEENFENLVNALNRMEIPYSIHKVIPFSHEMDPEVESVSGPVIVMGSVTLANMAKTKGFFPGAFINENFDQIVQLRYWKDALLNSDAFYCRFADVPERVEPFFIRPVQDTKSFSGCVYDWPSFKEWQTRVLALTPEDTPSITADTLVMVANVKKIYSETRCWVIDGKVITCSGYVKSVWRGINWATQPSYTPPEQVAPIIIWFVEELCEIWTPDRAFVMDIADTPDGLKVVEVNNINSSGFYKADMNKLVGALNSMVF